MKGASDAIKRSFSRAGEELEEMADTLEKEVANLARLSAYIKESETEKIVSALAEAKNVKSLMNDQRTELAALAADTIYQTDRIVTKFEDVIAKRRELDSGMRSMLRSMKNLLRSSEEKLASARTTINKLKFKVDTVLATLKVLKEIVKEVQMKEEALKTNVTAHDVTGILGDVVNTVTKGIKDANKAKTTKEQNTSIVQNVFSGISSLAVSVVKILQRPDVTELLGNALVNIDEATAIVEELGENMDRELQIVIQWKSAVSRVKSDVFGGKIGDKDDKYEEIKEIIEDNDTEEIYTAFAALKSAAQKYLDQVKKSCPTCLA